MNSNSFKYIFVLLFFSVICINGQQCSRQYQGEVESCNAFVPTGITVYVKNFTSYDELITTLTSETTRLSAVPGECSQLIIRYTCRSRLTECIQEGPLLFPRPNCMPICTDASPTCDIFFALGGNAANCNGTEPRSGLPLFLEPKTNFTGVVNGSQVSVSCSDAAEGEYVATCNFPLDKKNNGQCGIKCPDPMFSNGEYLAVDLIAKIGGWLSFFILAGVSITYIVDRQRKTWPMNIPYLLCISAAAHSFFMVVLPTLLNIGKETNAHWCSDAGTAARQEDASAACIIQGITIAYMAPHINGYLLVWTSIIIFQLLNIKQSGTMRFFPWGAVCCAILYLLPLVSVVTALSYGKIGYPRGSNFCNFWVTEELGVKLPTLWTLAALVIPALVMCAIVSLQLLTIIFLLYRAYRKVARLRKTNNESRFSYERRMIQYMVWNLIGQTTFFAFYFDSLTKVDGIKEGYQDWISCYANNPDGDCQLKTRPTYWLLIASTFAAVAYGGIGVFIFGLHKHVLDYWKPVILSYSSRFTPSGGDSASELTKRKSLTTTSTSKLGDASSGRSEDYVPMRTITSDSNRIEGHEEMYTKNTEYDENDGNIES